VRVLVGRHALREGLAGQRLVSTIQSLVQAGAQPVWGELNHAASLRAALADVRTVIMTADAGSPDDGSSDIPMSDIGMSDIGMPDRPTSDAGRRNTLGLIDAAQSAGARRFLLASPAADAYVRPDRLMSVNDEYEAALRRSGMNYTIVQPTNLMETWIGLMVGIPLMTGQAVTLIGRGDHAHNFISERDVAGYFIAMVDHPDAYNQTMMVGGPESCTWTEIVNRMRDRMGADLPIQYAMMGTPITYLPEQVNALVSEFERFEHYLDISETARTFGVRPTTLDEYIDRTFIG